MVAIWTAIALLRPSTLGGVALILFILFTAYYSFAYHFLTGSLFEAGTEAKEACFEAGTEAKEACFETGTDTRGLFTLRSDFALSYGFFTYLFLHGYLMVFIWAAIAMFQPSTPDGVALILLVLFVLGTMILRWMIIAQREKEKEYFFAFAAALGRKQELAYSDFTDENGAPIGEGCILQEYKYIQNLACKACAGTSVVFVRDGIFMVGDALDRGAEKLEAKIKRAAKRGNAVRIIGHVLKNPETVFENRRAAKNIRQGFFRESEPDNRSEGKIETYNKDLEMPVEEIASRLGLSKSSMAEVLEKLDKKDLKMPLEEIASRLGLS